MTKYILLVLLVIFSFNSSYAMNGVYDCSVDGSHIVLEISDKNLNFLGVLDNYILESKKISSSWVDESKDDIINKYKIIKHDDSLFYQYYSKVTDLSSFNYEVSLTSIFLNKQPNGLLFGTYSSVDIDKSGQQLEGAFITSILCILQ